MDGVKYTGERYKCMESFFPEHTVNGATISVTDNENIFSRMCNDKCPVYVWTEKNECIMYYPEADEARKTRIVERVKAKDGLPSGNLPKVRKWDLK
jgi:uncharacterized protein YcbX